MPVSFDAMSPYIRRRLAPLLVATLALVALVATVPPSYAQTPVTHYDCPNDNTNNGHYVPANHYWEQEFVAQGTGITGGFLLLGANVGDHDHTARIGIYTGSNRAGALEQIEQEVVGYGGVNFTFPMPIAVSPGEHLHIAATGVGDFTAYDELPGGVDGCFIGRIDGYASSAGEVVPPPAEPESPPAQAPSPQGPRPSTVNPAVAHFSRSGAVAWADHHVNSKPRFKADDCTNYVSMAWTHGGGLGQQGWWYLNEGNPLNILNLTYSNTWAAAENFANVMTAHSWATRTNISNLSVKTVPGAQPGDVLLWHDHNGGSSTFWSHTALVAGNAAHGLTLIDQHSEPRYHTTWNDVWRKAGTKERRILRAQLLHVRTG